ncbi:MAG TPA: aldehyde dehydrogenase family protein [Acidimicrobiales bacterium]|nr:aldehyde dehydrogenase family protein [Acidimicrobiales bacterium]
MVQVYDKLFIDGAWVAPSGTGSIEVLSSSDESVVATIPRGDEDDVNRAAAAAKAAFESWSTTPVEERAKYLDRIAEGLMARMDEIATYVSQEVGMPKTLSTLVQVGLPLASFQGASQGIQAFQFEEQLGNSVVVKEPVGVVASITPWNYPLHQLSAKVAPALAAGCTVVAKPSQVAPISAFILAEIIADVGLPPGVFNLVSGAGAEVGEAIATHPDVDMVSFTGSTRAGRRVAELGAQTIKRVTLELGGKSANVILEDADLERAITDGVGKCFLNSGQTCSALTRMLVPRDKLAEAEEIAARVAQTFTPGDPFADTTRLGPLASKAQLDTVRGYIQKGLDEGATLVTGGAESPEGLEQGYYVQPTVFTADNSMTIAQEEIFGPVLTIIPFDDEDDAVRIANDSPYGLAGGVWSGDQEHAKAVARRIRTGQVEINGGGFNVQAPFGGYKQSGYGRELGPHGLDEFFELKALQL